MRVKDGSQSLAVVQQAQQAEASAAAAVAVDATAPSLVAAVDAAVNVAADALAVPALELERKTSRS